MSRAGGGDGHQGEAGLGRPGFHYAARGKIVFTEVKENFFIYLGMLLRLSMVDSSSRSSQKASGEALPKLFSVKKRSSAALKTF